MKYLYILIVFILIKMPVKGQSKWNWPEDSAESRVKLTLYTDYYRAGDFKASEEHLRWLLDNAKDLNPSIYIHGVRIYDELAAMSVNSEIKEGFLEEKLRLYDQRMEIYGKTPDLLKRKLIAAYKFRKNDPSKLMILENQVGEVFDQYDNAIPEKIFIIAVDILKGQVKAGFISNPDLIMEKYRSIIAQYDQNSIRSANTYHVMEKLIGQVLKFDCPILEKWFQENPANDTTWTKRAMHYAINNKCTNSDFFINAGKEYMKIAPSHSLAKLLALRNEKKGESDEALTYYQQAIELAKTNDEQYDSQLALSKFYFRKKNWPLAKQHALKAINIKPSSTEGQELIGDLYYQGASSCMKKISRVKDRAIYIAAYNRYQKAGNRKKMNLAAQQFPSGNSIFEELLKEGDEVNIGCWVNEKVKLKKRLNMKS